MFGAIILEIVNFSADPEPFLNGVTPGDEDVGEVHICLAWWPPELDEPLGTERALELVQRLKEVAVPIVAEAEADLRARSSPGMRITGGGAPARYFAGLRLGPEMQSLCVGTVSQVGRAHPESNSIHLGRDGVLRWRRD